jgi:uncharacterized protein (TIGR02145 family)
MNKHTFLTKLSKHWLRGAIVALLTLFVFSQVQAQNAVFVSASATDDNGDGTTWATAKKTIAAGVTAAGSNGTVYVKAGLYSTTAEFTVPAGVTVKGGYLQSSTDADTTQRNLPGVNSHWGTSTWCTIISGAGNHRIATVNGTLDGCVVRYGFTTTIGGGLLIDGGTARHCVLIWNDAINDDEGTAEGGGAYVRNNGMMLNCVVTECRGDNGSGVSGEDGSLINNTITRNWPSQCGTVTDYDGNVYHTVQIGAQCWMKENLRTTHYADGVAIPTTSSYSSTVAYRYYPNNSASNAVTYGLLYNWTATMHGVESSDANPSGVQGVCPDGWHVPSDNEWTQLTDYVSSRSVWRCNGSSNNIAKALASKIGWNSSSGSCYVGNTPSNNNATRFSAIPAGRYSYYYGYSYSGISQYSYFWSSTQISSDNAFRVTISYGSAEVGRDSNGNDDNKKWNAHSVRCLRDE